MEVPQKTKIRISVDPAIPLLGRTEKSGKIENTNLKRYKYPNIHSSSINTAKTQKQPQCLKTGNWIKKMWYIFIMEYYSAIKKNEILLLAVMWMDLENIMLGKVRDTK